MSNHVFTTHASLEELERHVDNSRTLLSMIAGQVGRQSRALAAMRAELEASRCTTCRSAEGERRDLAVAATPPEETHCTTLLRFLRDPQTAPATANGAAAEQGAELGETPLTTALRLVRASRVAPAAAGPRPKQAARKT